MAKNVDKGPAQLTAQGTPEMGCVKLVMLEPPPIISIV